MAQAERQIGEVYTDPVNLRYFGGSVFTAV